ncbi:hypothetical protein EC973_000219 [Apophysomyces ossiformis]|uniref:Uncharacterized protein n=1 Tax=Apophysomyces ossiformis TaxID=679940 RepID=A0A8H7BX29_9FUNG|nr:hypothetical protein EC973_000219 [Apophysomyces ossiformis]
MTFSAPLLRRWTQRSRNPFWEQNEWYRQHGYQTPIDPYLILQWVCSILLDIAFFCYLGEFVSDIPATDYEEIQQLLTYWSLADDSVAIQSTSSWPLAAWSWYIMLGLGTAVKILSITTSAISTEDPVVAAQREQVPRSKTYVRKYGVPVIDSTTGICAIRVLGIEGSIDNADTALTSAFYIGAGLSSIITILAVTAVVAMLRLLVFHIQLGYLNMTTIEFLNHPSNQPSLYDSDDDEDYETDSDFDLEEGDGSFSDNPWKRPWSPSMISASPRRGWPYVRMLKKKSGRAWRRFMLCFLPKHRYRQLTRYQRRASWLRWIPFLDRQPRRRRQRRSHAYGNNMNMDDMFATRTIRPIVVLNEEGPDYEDDMGLDFSVLSEKRSSVDAKPQRNKAARLLDISEEEAFRYQQQLHHSVGSGADDPI